MEWRYKMATIRNSA